VKRNPFNTPGAVFWLVLSFLTFLLATLFLWRLHFVLGMAGGMFTALYGTAWWILASGDGPQEMYDDAEELLRDDE